jgi:hypothetical protein
MTIPPENGASGEQRNVANPFSNTSELTGSNTSELTGGLFWDRRRPRLPTFQQKELEWRRMQARTPAVPEERAHVFGGVTEG